MAKSEFDLYHEDEVLSVPTNRINTSKGSQTEQMMQVFDSIIYDHIQDHRKIADLNDLDNAVGGQLDDIGEDIGLYRLGKTDDIYRFLIKMKSIYRTSQGTVNEIIDLVSHAFNVPNDEVRVYDDYVIDDNGQAKGTPLHVSIDNLPMDNIEHAEAVPSIMEALQNALALGITLSRVGFVSYPQTALGIGTATVCWSEATVISDVGTQDFVSEANNTSYVRSTQQVTTHYTIESEEVSHG